MDRIIKQKVQSLSKIRVYPGRENRSLKEKLHVIDRDRQDLRLILESRELQEEEERNEMRKGIEQEWELERIAFNRLRDKTIDYKGTNPGNK